MSEYVVAAKRMSNKKDFEFPSFITFSSLTRPQGGSIIPARVTRSDICHPWKKQASETGVCVGVHREVGEDCGSEG